MKCQWVGLWSNVVIIVPVSGEEQRLLQGDRQWSRCFSCIIIIIPKVYIYKIFFLSVLCDYNLWVLDYLLDNLRQFNGVTLATWKLWKSLFYFKTKMNKSMIKTQKMQIMQILINNFPGIECKPTKNLCSCKHCIAVAESSVCVSSSICWAAHTPPKKDQTEATVVAHLGTVDSQRV